jgi:hypothetical protein
MWEITSPTVEHDQAYHTPNNNKVMLPHIYARLIPHCRLTTREALDAESSSRGMYDPAPAGAGKYKLHRTM